MYYNLQTWRLPLQAHWAPLQIMRQLWHLALLHLQQTPLDLGEQVDAVFCNLFFKYLDLVKHWSNVSFPPPQILSLRPTIALQQAYPHMSRQDNFLYCYYFYF